MPPMSTYVTNTQWMYLVGLRYNLEKKDVPNPEGVNQYDEVEDQNDPPPTTAERLAEEYGVSAPTVKRAGQFADAVAQLKPHVPDIQQRVMKGDVPSRASEGIDTWFNINSDGKVALRGSTGLGQVFHKKGKGPCESCESKHTVMTCPAKTESWIVHHIPLFVDTSVRKTQFPIII